MNKLSKKQLYSIIFEADTPNGKLYDIALLITIVLSVLVVMLDSVAPIRDKHGPLLKWLEWIFTALFTIEYVIRLICVRKKLKYAFSFFGIVDFLGVIPTYLALIPLFHTSRFLVAIRFLRILRTFRVLKLSSYQGEANALMQGFKASSKRIAVFLFTVLALVVVLGSLMYVIEHQQPEAGFTSIPTGIYWAIVTMTTVGYGDISPVTALGKTIAAVVMILGYSIIAVPTGIVSVEMANTAKKSRKCGSCNKEGHDPDAQHCKYCGHKLA